MRRIPAASRNRRPLRCELLESRILLDGHGIVDPPLEPGLIYGRVWEDANANRHLDAGEGGMGGVTVYSDLNFNGHLDPDEPSAVTIFDNPSTDVDEGGFYILDQLQPGFHNVREIVPDGFEQTWPSLPPGFLPPPWGDPSVHVVFVGSGAAVDDVDFGNRQLELGMLCGTKWEDLNGNAERDPNERGLAGVTIYVDRNDNGIFEPDEPHTVTSADDPTTDFDESGRYRFDGLPAGDYVIREVVPFGYEQTFPHVPIPQPSPEGAGLSDEFATVHPERLDLTVAPGDVIIVDAAITIHPSIFAPIEIDVFAEPPTGAVFNVSGLQVNGGTGDTSVFQLLIMGDGIAYEGRLAFIDAAAGNAIASIPLTINAHPPLDGTHRVTLRPGQHLDRIDFGNRPLANGFVEGRKWLDANGNGIRESDEPGLEGVTIYADFNQNGVLDSNEPSTITAADIPETDFDEGGFYHLELPAGEHWIAEVVPHGFVQTFPNHPVPAIFPPPPGGRVHEVLLAPGEVLSGIDFGNRRVENGFVSGRTWVDMNANAEHDPDETGMGGVTIYADYNFNSVHDVGEPSTLTMHDIPETDFDEAGMYFLEARPGFQAIRQVVPFHHFQTFPTSAAASPLEQGAHFVNVEPNAEIPNLNFGNFPIEVPPPLPGDFNGDGIVDRGDLDVWETEFGAEGPAIDASHGHGMNGASLLTWQRAAQPLPVPAAATSSALPALNLDGSPMNGSSENANARTRRARNVARDAVFSDSSQANWRTVGLDVPAHDRAESSQPSRQARRLAPRDTGIRELGDVVSGLSAGDN